MGPHILQRLRFDLAYEVKKRCQFAFDRGPGAAGEHLRALKEKGFIECALSNILGASEVEAHSPIYTCIRVFIGEFEADAALESKVRDRRSECAARRKHAPFVIWGRLG